MRVINQRFMNLLKEFFILLFKFYMIAQAVPLTLLHREKIEHIRQITDNRVKKCLVKVWKMAWENNVNLKMRNLVFNLHWNANFLLLSLGEAHFESFQVNSKRFQILQLLLSSYKNYQPFWQHDELYSQDDLLLTIRRF